MQDKSLQKDSFYLKNKYWVMIQKLTIEQRGLIFTAIFEYEIERKITKFDDLLIDMIFSVILTDSMHNNKKYNAACDKKSKAMINRHAKKTPDPILEPTPKPKPKEQTTLYAFVGETLLQRREREAMELNDGVHK